TMGDILRLTGFDYSGVITDVAQMTSVTALQQALSATRSVGGDVVGFNFGTGFVPAPGGGGTDTSAELLIRTDAHVFQPRTIGLVDGGGATLAGFAPKVPEPSSAVLLSLGGVALAARRRWSRER